MTLAKPFIKWVGGKSQLLDEISEKYPQNIEKYCEPFVGGGAVLFALFIFLNKTCFNGLYRVNSKGLFNVPYNNAKNPLLCDEENLRACSEVLQNVEMRVGDYKECKDFIVSMGVPAKAVGCSALRCGGLLRRCSIA